MQMIFFDQSAQIAKGGLVTVPLPSRSYRVCRSYAAYTWGLNVPDALGVRMGCLERIVRMDDFFYRPWRVNSRN